MLLILTAKLLGIVPNEYPDTCECGFLFNTGGQDNKMTSITCSNPLCPVTSQFTIVEMLEKLNIKVNLGEEKAGIIVDYILSLKDRPFTYNCCIDLIGVPEDCTWAFPQSVISPIVMLRNEVKKINESGGITLPVYMNLFCFDGLGETYCKRIFSTYSTIEDFYKDFDSKMDSRNVFIASFINQNWMTPTVQNIVNILDNNRSEILRCSKYFVFKEVSSLMLQICITGEITKVLDENGLQFKPRDKFAEYVRDKYKVNIVLNKSFNKAVDFVVCDKPSSTRKAVAARSLARKDVYSSNPDSLAINNTRLITSEELIKIIEKGVN